MSSRVGHRPAVSALGGLLLLISLFGGLRPDPMDASLVFAVTSTQDSGPGTLRQAIFEANRAGRKSLIRVDVDRLEPRHVLPPITNTRGVLFEGQGVILSGTWLGSEPVLQVASPYASILDVEVVDASAAGFVVSAPGVRLEGFSVRHSQHGVVVAHPAQDVVLARGELTANRIGIRVDGGAEVIVRDSLFVGHLDAAIRAVDDHDTAQGALRVTNNTFAEDRISLIVGSRGALVSENEFGAPREVAIFVTGSDVVVQSNRLRSGPGNGITLSRSHGAIVTDNEITGFGTLALLVSQSRGAAVRNNRVQGNAYGIVVVSGDRSTPTVVQSNHVKDQSQDGLVVVAAAPLVRHNHLLGNGGASIRLLDLVPRSGENLAEPSLDGNVIEHNGHDRPLKGVYREHAGS